jgi:hypothetical protein
MRSPVAVARDTLPCSSIGLAVPTTPNASCADTGHNHATMGVDTTSVSPSAVTNSSAPRHPPRGPPGTVATAIAVISPTPSGAPPWPRFPTATSFVQDPGHWLSRESRGSTAASDTGGWGAVRRLAEINDNRALDDVLRPRSDTRVMLANERGRHVGRVCGGRLVLDDTDTRATVRRSQEVVGNEPVEPGFGPQSPCDH